MKKLFALFFAAVLSLSTIAFAGVEITKVDKAKPTDEMFMDMAVVAAKKSVAAKGIPAGAVIILNGAWRATGLPSGTKSPEEDAFSKARRQTLKNATVYTVNEPTTETINFLNSLGVEAVYFVNPRDAVIAAGIYPAEAYNDEALDASLPQAPIICMPYADATALIKK